MIIRFQKKNTVKYEPAVLSIENIAAGVFFILLRGCLLLILFPSNIMLCTNEENFHYQYYKQFWRNEVRAFMASVHWSQVNLQSDIRVDCPPFLLGIRSGVRPRHTPFF